MKNIRTLAGIIGAGPAGLLLSHILHLQGIESIVLEKSNRGDLLDSYSATALRRIWKATRFSWWMTSMMHSFPGADEFQHRLQVAELDYVCGSKAGSTALAENYLGLPIM